MLVGVAYWRSTLSCSESDRACVAKKSAAHAVRRMAYWQKLPRSPELAERIGPAPQELVEYLNLDNIKSGYSDRPRRAQLDEAFLHDVRDAIRELPQQVKAQFGERLLGIYFVEDLGSIGYTDMVFDQDGKPVAGVIVLDSKLLQKHSANTLATWKENKPFRWHSDFQLKAQLEAPEGDNRKNAIQYILLHELGHVLSIGGSVHPPWTTLAPPADANANTNFNYPFFNLSWLPSGTSFSGVSRFDSNFSLRKRVVYYSGALLNADQMLDTYTQLEGTNFPSLYAATRPADDFAEAFANYVHVVLQKRPWQITMFRGGSVVKQFNACWGTPRCAGKQALLEDMLRTQP